MARYDRRFIGVGLVAATCVWFTTLRADDETTASAATEPAVLDSPAKESPAADQIAQLGARIEKLEKRIATLETALEQSTRQVNAVEHPAGIQWQPNQIAPNGKPIVPPPQSQEQNWPPVRFRLLKTTVTSK